MTASDKSWFAWAAMPVVFMGAACWTDRQILNERLYPANKSEDDPYCSSSLLSFIANGSRVAEGKGADNIRD